MAISDAGTIRAQMVLDVRKAIENFTAVRIANLQTVTALRTGGGALVGLGVGMAAVGAGLLVALGKAVQAAADFERQLDFFGAVSDTTAADMDKVREAAILLGQDTIYSAGQIVDSFVELGKAGVTASDIIGGVGEAVAYLGAAADIPLDTAANIILAAVQTYGLSADKAVHVADLLAGAANASIVEVEDLGISLKYAGGTARALGIPLGDTIDALSLLGKYGIKGSTAGTSLRQTFLSLGGTTVKAKDALKDLGIITADGSNQFYTAEGNAKSLAEIFQILQDATAGMSAEQKVATFRTIFQTRAMSTALSLTNEGAAGFANMNKEISKTTAMEVASKRLDNLSGDIEILSGNIETMAIQQGSKLQEFLRGVVQWITKVVQAFNNLSPGMQEFIIKAIAVTGVVLVILGVLTSLAGSLLILIAATKQMIPAFQLLIALMKGSALATWALNSALLANPITWIIVGIIALIAVFVLLWRNNEGFRNFFIRMWDGIKAATSSVIEWFKGLPAWFSTTWTTIKDFTLGIWNSILAFFQGIPAFIMNLFYNWTLVGLIISHWTEIQTFTMNIWNGILDWFQQIPTRMAEFFSSLPERIGFFIGFMIGTVTRLVLTWRAWMIEKVTNLVNTIVDWFKELPGRVLEAFNTMKDWVVDKFIEISIWLVTKTMNLVDSVTNWFKRLPGNIRDAFISAKNWVVQKFTEMSIWAINKASEIYNGIINWFTQLPGKIRDAFVDAKTWVTDKFGQVKTEALRIAINIYNSVINWVKKIPDKVKELFTDAINKIKNLASTAANAVKDFGSGLWNGFKKGMGINSPSYIEKAMFQMTDTLDAETQKMKRQVRSIQSLGDGINKVGSDMGEGFDTSLTAGLNSMQAQLRAAQEYNKQLQLIASTSAESYRAGAPGIATPGSQVVVQGGNQVTLDVNWNAAPNDTVSTRQQAKDMLGRAATILGADLETSNGN